MAQIWTERPPGPETDKKPTSLSKDLPPRVKNIDRCAEVELRAPKQTPQRFESAAPRGAIVQIRPCGKLPNRRRRRHVLSWSRPPRPNFPSHRLSALLLSLDSTWRRANIEETRARRGALFHLPERRRAVPVRCFA